MTANQNDQRPATSAQPTRLLAVASGGGHWVQLLRLRPAFEGCEVVYVTVSDDYRASLDPASRLCVVRDATRWNRFGLVLQAIQVFWIVLRERPDIVLTTGAAPGYFALRVGKLLGARTVWIDSIANANELSMAGERAGKFADLWLTQWPHLARSDGPKYCGEVI